VAGVYRGPCGLASPKRQAAWQIAWQGGAKRVAMGRRVLQRGGQRCFSEFS
jgi:hypothetical protein